jgi:hypothetical protein
MRAQPPNTLLPPLPDTQTAKQRFRLEDCGATLGSPNPWLVRLHPRPRAPLRPRASPRRPRFRGRRRPARAARAARGRRRGRRAAAAARAAPDPPPAGASLLLPPRWLLMHCSTPSCFRCRRGRARGARLLPRAAPRRALGFRWASAAPATGTLGGLIGSGPRATRGPFAPAVRRGRRGPARVSTFRGSLGGAATRWPGAGGVGDARAQRAEGA